MAKRIALMTYCRVVAGGAPVRRGSRPRDAGIDAFLIGHVESLMTRAASGDAPLAEVVDVETAGLFAQLAEGKPKSFYDAAHQMALRLVGEMDGRTSPGLLVCLRLAEPNEPNLAAALKLEVITPNSAVLDRLDSGEEVLSSVTNVLDAPGDLQKGAVYPDRRPQSQIVLGDRLPREALYFPRALGVRVEEKAIPAAAAMVKAIQAISPDVAEKVAVSMPELDSGRVEDVLARAAEELPELSVDVQQRAAAALNALPRPARRVDTSAPLRKTIRADGITISGLVQRMNQAVRMTPGPTGGYVITVTVQNEPTTEYGR